MSSKLTAKQEAFCYAYMETGNASEAYRKSYSAENMKMETVNRSAKELLDNPKITARINLLRGEVAQRHQVTVDDLLEELEDARQAALAALVPQSSAAVAATMGKAKLLGIGADKVELSGKVEMPTEALDAKIVALIEKLGAK
jgi:phage terminase small subunit